VTTAGNWHDCSRQRGKRPNGLWKGRGEAPSGDRLDLYCGELQMVPTSEAASAATAPSRPWSVDGIPARAVGLSGPSWLGAGPRGRQSSEEHRPQVSLSRESMHQW
jgi:hypothetical protein